MLLIRGQSVYCPFRNKRLLEKCQQILPNIASVFAVYVYFVELEQHLSADEREMLCELLGASDELDPTVEQQMIVVLPRGGTISPWSSKATDIVYNCGLEKISRLERGIIYQIGQNSSATLTDSELQMIYPLLYDPMTEDVGSCLEDAEILFAESSPADLGEFNVLGGGRDALLEANKLFGTEFSETDIAYLIAAYSRLQRNPTDTELMMYAVINSEHCRHKIFNAKWIIDSEQMPYSLFEMIKQTTRANDAQILKAYDDNAAVVKGHDTTRFFRGPDDGIYKQFDEDVHIVFKVETHNHPTAISPFPGAATGAGGEIRDEGATGRGAKPKAGLIGYAVSNLHIPDFAQPWETKNGKPRHVATALDIMLEAPIGAAAFNNEFGRPNLCGYFRTYEQEISGTHGSEYRGYHKPILIAGGIGHIRDGHIQKAKLGERVHIVILGGPAMKIGLGGGVASSRVASEGRETLDYGSVQRGNPEMQRRAQEVIDHCWSLGENNPILSIHDVGAGGLSNAIPEILHESHCGGRFELRAIPNDDISMSPMAIWCNEAQERYVLAIAESNLDAFYEVVERERCLYSQVGEVTNEPELVLGDGYFDTMPIDLPMSVLFPDHSQAMKEVSRLERAQTDFDWRQIDLSEAAKRVLHCPAVADKSFLITIGDRTVGGLTVRDQMVGPWQIPVADAAVTATSFYDDCGEALAMGERPMVALLDHGSSVRLAVGEAITNLVSTDIEDFEDIVLSANWMCAVDYPGEAAGLYDGVASLSEFCQQLKLPIPVGKDSLSMQMRWQHQGEARTMASPLSLVITAVARVSDVEKSVTPQLITDEPDTVLMFIDLAMGKSRMGAGILAQVFNDLGREPPDVDNPRILPLFFNAMQKLKRNNLVLAYHDRSDGGLFTTLVEMAFAGHCGWDLDITNLGEHPNAILFNEELGAVIQVRRSDVDRINAILGEHELGDANYILGEVKPATELKLRYDNKVIYQSDTCDCQQQWSALSYHMQMLRDNPDTAQQAYDAILDEHDPGLHAALTFDDKEMIAAPYINSGVRPEVAILREQGVNGHVEMAAAFTDAGFNAVDIHMSDILENRVTLERFKGLVACGGFSYGDVLGAGRGWAKTIIFNPIATEQFYNFFHRADTFTLGVCNGCQMLANLKTFIPGAELWPTFKSNVSEQFEARLTMVEIAPSSSIFFTDMDGSRLPIVVAHREGKLSWPMHNRTSQLKQNQMIALQYINNYGEIVPHYPSNPNGSEEGITGVSSKDGRVTIMMPHPERVFLSRQFSWKPREWGERSPWARMFHNARLFVG